MNQLTDFIQQRRAGMQATNSSRLLMAHVIFGYPSVEESIEIMHLILDSGVALLEVQFPFSDPVADGPLITQACHQALEEQPDLTSCLSILTDLAAAYPDSRLVLMSYLNPLLQFGFERLSSLADGSISGLIIPDLPIEHRQLLEPLQNTSLTPIWLLTPDTEELRLQQIVNEADGMLYCVSRKGVTGQQGNSAQPLQEYLTRVRTHTSLPLGVGFGIQSAEEIRALPQQADIAIVGSGLLRAYQNGGLDRLRELLISLQNA